MAFAGWGWVGAWGVIGYLRVEHLCAIVMLFWSCGRPSCVQTNEFLSAANQSVGTNEVSVGALD